MNIYKEMKWACQRVFRGWDDRVVWSVDWWLNDIMPPILRKLKQDKHGIPIEFFGDISPSEIGDNEEEEKCAEDLWNAEIDKMILGFESAKKICEYEWETTEELEQLNRNVELGMESFKKNYFNLWD